MIERLVPCGGCSRHVRCSESACPFCGVAVSADPPPQREAFRRMAAAAAVAAGVAALTGCSSGHSSIAFYGACGCGGGDDASSNDASNMTFDGTSGGIFYGGVTIYLPEAGDAGDARADGSGDGPPGDAADGGTSTQADSGTDGPEGG